MISVEFQTQRNVYVAGEEFDVLVRLDDGNSNINVNVYKVGIENPSFQYCGPTRNEDIGFSSTIKTISFLPGYYEVRHIKTFNCKNEMDITNEKNYSSGTHFQRFVFQVVPAGVLPKQKINLLNDIESIESDFEKEFLGGLSCSPGENQRKYWVLVFLCGVKITRRMRFGRYEAIPFRGLDGTNLVDLVNEFISTQTKVSLKFNYSEELSRSIRNDSPICIIHFPLVRAIDKESAMRYCQEEAELLSEVMSSFRGGFGRVVKTVVYDNDTAKGTMFTARIPYRGNLLGGEISGEDPKAIGKILDIVRSSPLKKYFLSLYKEAISEINIDFSYLRYWQLLETIAESKNYNPSDILLDIEGQIIKKNNGTSETLKDSKAKVYELVKGHGLGTRSLKANAPRPGSLEATEYNLWDRIKAWHSMRNSASHFGGYVHDDELLKRTFRGYETCEALYLDQGGNKHGFLYEDLKSTAWLILRKELAGG